MYISCIQDDVILIYRFCARNIMCSYFVVILILISNGIKIE